MRKNLLPKKTIQTQSFRAKLLPDKNFGLKTFAKKFALPPRPKNSTPLNPRILKKLDNFLIFLITEKGT